MLADKGESGEKKLADRESAVYVVATKNDKLHTYSIRQPATGQIRMVHRNLIMPVNFLPLPSWGESDQKVEFSVPSASQIQDTVSMLGQMEQSDARWISDLSEPRVVVGLTSPSCWR